MDGRAAFECPVEGLGVVHVPVGVIDPFTQNAPRTRGVPGQDPYAVAIVSQPLDDGAPEHARPSGHQDSLLRSGLRDHLTSPLGYVASGERRQASL